jgi:lysophospholipase L1-like esterase
MCSSVVTFVLILVKTKWVALLLGFLLVIGILWSFSAYLYRKRRPLEWLLTLAVFNLFVVLPELVLRAVDFHYEAGIQFGYPRPTDFLAYAPDEKLFWKHKLSDEGVNTDGFKGGQIVIPKPGNVFRILFLGDSVTEQGLPELVEHFLNARASQRAKVFESASLAIAGYSSYQGLVAAELYGLRYEPDLVIVFFGWNDHWKAYGSTDSKKRIEPLTGTAAILSGFAYHHVRLLQGLNAVSGSITRRNDWTGEVRVPLDDYQANLVNLRELFQRSTVPVIFITAPTSHYRLGVPQYLINMNFVHDKESVVTLHKAYNEVVRQVADDGAILLDLDSEISSASHRSLRALFMDDGIHLTSIGLAVIGARIADLVQALPVQASSGFGETTFRP